MKIIKRKQKFLAFYFILILIFVFFNLIAPKAIGATLTCDQKYPDGQCLANCPSGASPDTGSGLCSSGQKCCHTLAAPATITLQVPIFQYTTVNNIADYIKTIYKYTLYILVPIAILIIIWAGIQWIVAGGNVAKIKEAKKYISGAIVGILIGLLSYVILSFVGITSLTTPDISYIEYNELEDGEIAADLSLPANQQPSGVRSQGQSCFLSTYGSSADQVKANLAGVNFGGHGVRVHKLAQPAFAAASQKIASSGLTGKLSVGTFNWRPNRNNPSVLSLHSFGIAIDINVPQNGNCHPSGDKKTLYQQLRGQLLSSNPGELCRKAKDFGCTCNHDPRLLSAMISSGFRWGAYKSTFDSMHFEWTGKCFGK